MLRVPLSLPTASTILDTIVRSCSRTMKMDSNQITETSTRSMQSGSRLRLFAPVIFASFILTLITSSVHAIELTHGPVLGRPGHDTMTIWVRSDRPGQFQVKYGVSADALKQSSEVGRTSLAHDNTGTVTLEGLSPNTRYFYEVDTVPPSGARQASFRTFPRADDYRNESYNPDGLFNFSFEFGCCNNQRHGEALKVPLQTYETMNRQVANDISFAILNGDWIYEEQREYSVDQWRAQTGTSEADVPEILQISPAITGVWENYKLYWNRAPHLRDWHAHVPSFYTIDDHELVNDIYGCATAGFRNRRAVFRDPAMRAWFDYLAWANPHEHDRPAHFGTARFEAGSDLLVDLNSDLRTLPLDEMATLHVHFGGHLAGVQKPEPDPELGNPNLGVYRIKEVLGPHEARITPPAVETGNASYSIGRRTYGKFRVSNCDFFLLDTRTHRDLHDVKTPADPKRSMLGERQLKWLMKSMKESDADFFFLSSTVNFMVPHVGAGAATLDRNKAAAKDDAWTVFLHEREKLIDFWSAEIDAPVFLLTGDLHNSFAIHITDNVWEFASAPHNSPNHRSEIDAGGLPVQGTFQYGPRKCDVRWSSYVMSDIPREHRKFPNYCVVQINNVFDNPTSPDSHRWIAYPRPQIIFQFFDGRTGKLKYSETIQAPPKGDR